MKKQPTQSDLLKFYRDEIRRSKRWREQDQLDESWRRMVDLYRGKHYKAKSKNDQLIVNLAFATKNVMAPAVAINNPRFTVNARNFEDAPNAVITEEVLNYLWRTYRYQTEFRLAVDDWIILGHGWLKTGYLFKKPPEEKAVETDDADAAETGIDDRDPIPGNVETELTSSVDDRPFVERISPFDMFVDPDARHPKEMRWIAQRTWRAIQDVKVDERYSDTNRRRVTASSRSRWEQQDGRDSDTRPDRGAIEFCEIIEFYDLKRGTVATFASAGGDDDDTRGDGFLIKPDPMPYASGQPFTMLRNYEVPDHFYPMGDLEQIESLQMELNETRNQMIGHRKKFARKWTYDESAFDKAGVDALESDVDGVMVPIKGGVDPGKAVQALPAVITPPEFYNQSNMISEDIDRVSGVSDYQRGGQTAIKRTATAAGMIQDAANARAQDRLAKIEGILAELGENIIALMQQYLTGDHVARIVTMPGRAWVNYNNEFIQGKFDFEVQGGSTEPRNETFRRQSAMQLVDASMPFLEGGIVNPVALYQNILASFGIKDVGRFIAQQGPPPVPGQEQAPPGGPPGLPPGGPPVPGQMPLPGMPPAPIPEGAPLPV